MLVLFLILNCVLWITNGEIPVLRVQPEQIHLSLGINATQMIVTWLTVNATQTSVVEYGTDSSLLETANGLSTLFIDGGEEKRSMFIHRAVMKNLVPGKRYLYHCGSDEGWSAVYSFQSIKEGSDWSPRFAVYGDMGNVNGQSIPRLQKDVERGLYDAILHVGDFAYDMNTDNARVGDEFMRQIEPIAAYVPYMATVGNHEEAYNFSNYVNRFSMVNLEGDINNHFYSYNIGPAHIISFSTEFYFYVNYGFHQIVNQFEWLEKDLIEANKAHNRAKHPWIITLGHRPIYCTTFNDSECYNFESLVRKTVKFGSKQLNLEDLFYKYGVDLEIWAHLHNYERLLPIYNRTIHSGSKSEPYRNPKAPIHIITGSAGCHERHDPFDKELPEWSAFRSEDYGYTRMTIVNSTHLTLDQVSDDQKGKIVDSIVLIKEKHGPQAWL